MPLTTRQSRSWQDIALEASVETDPNRLMELCDELDRAFEITDRIPVGGIIAARTLVPSTADELISINSYRNFSRSRSADLLNSVIEVTGADFGNVQLLDSSEHVLRIVAHQGFDNEFLNYFETVRAESGCACGAAMERQTRLMVADVASDPIFDDPARHVLSRANVRAVQSTPLIDAEGNLIGVVSTHYREPGVVLSPEAQAELDAFVCEFLAE